jgi:hypothetical protein
MFKSDREIKKFVKDLSAERKTITREIKALYTKKNMVQKDGEWVLTPEANAKLRELKKRGAAVAAKVETALKPVKEQMEAERAERRKRFQSTLRKL